MPTYDYECQTCRHQFEVVQSMNDPRLTACPQPGCNGTVERKIGRGAGIIFKGSGFYQTDYRSDSYKAAAKKESESTAATASPAPAPAPKESSAGSSSSTAAAASSSGGGSGSGPAPSTTKAA